MAVVGRRRVGDAPLAPGVHVAEVVGERLQLVRAQIVVVPEHVVAGGLGGALKLFAKKRALKQYLRHG
jgi:hypothetical protein